MNQVNTTRIGRKWELWAHKYLFPTAKLMTNINRNAPYDLNLNGARVNVKASKLYSKKHGKYFDFMLKHTHDGCDYFLCIGYRYRRDKEPVKVWLIPTCCVVDKYRLTIGPNHTGQWAEFEREIVTGEVQALKGAI